ncbi:hypothetical protein RUM43_001235 [Polyplax serrata]|uniref:Uncharacterized protein n=1 Tax=Polyplax serrata TaxID=468196 RepID=A0AAN8SF13_POLSC
MTESTEEVQKIRHDWYQTDTHVFLNIFCRNVKNFCLNYHPESIDVSFCSESDQIHNLSFNLRYEIYPVECSYKILPSKVEVKLKKKEGVWWDTFDRKEITDTSKNNPTSSVKTKNWDKVVGDMTNKDDDKLEGDAALNALFQRIYAEGSDEVKKAMNKSFSESAGTVLSTNWKEIKGDKVDVKPPDGVEWKKWD